MTDLVFGATQVLLLIAATDVLGMSRGGFGALSAALGAGSHWPRSSSSTGPPARAGRCVVLGVAVLATGLPLAAVAVANGPPMALVLVGILGLGSVVTDVLALTTLQRLHPQRPPGPGVRHPRLTAGRRQRARCRRQRVAGGPRRHPGDADRHRRRSGDHRGRRGRPGAPPRRGRGGRPHAPAPRRRPPGRAADAADGQRRQHRGAGRRGHRAVGASRDGGHPPGDAPDDFYAIIRGRFDVIVTSSDGAIHRRCSLGEGDGFGEIGLLHGVPRTATVVATTESRVLQAPGRRFSPSGRRRQGDGRDRSRGGGRRLLHRGVTAAWLPLASCVRPSASKARSVSCAREHLVVDPERDRNFW